MNKLLIVSFFLLNGLLYSQTYNYKYEVNNCYDKTSKLNFTERGKAIRDCLIGIETPNFKAVTINNDSIELKKYLGNVVVINFWFISCAPCIAEMPGLNDIVKKYINDSVKFISITKETKSNILDFFSNKKHFDFEIISDNEEIFREIFSFKVGFGYPTTLVIDKEGVIRYIKSGGYSDKRAKNAIKNDLLPIIDELISLQ